MRQVNVIKSNQINETSPIMATSRCVATTSSKYKFISTREVLPVFERAGFSIVDTRTSWVRKLEKQGFQKHVVRLRPTNLLQARNVGEVYPELLLVNSHDGTTGFSIRLGLYRMVCSNGLVTGKSFFNFSVKHVGNAQTEVERAIVEVLPKIELLTNLINRMRAIELTEHVRTLFALEALKLRAQLTGLELTYDRPEIYSSIYDALAVRRDADTSNDLFTVFNRIQENIVNGLFKVPVIVPETLEVKFVKLRAINSLSTNIKLNGLLFDLALNKLSEIGA